METDSKGNRLSSCELGGIAKSTRCDDTLCDEIKFHIPNLKAYNGICISYSPNQASYRRIVMKDGDWEITIDGVENIDDLIKELRRDGGGCYHSRGCPQAKAEPTIQNL